MLAERRAIMKLDVRAFAIAAAITAAALFLICASFVVVMPKETTNLAGYLIHADLSGISRSLTWGNFFGGLACWTAGAGIVAGALSWLYNGLARAETVRTRGTS